MAKFTSKTIVTVNQLTVDNDTATYTSTQCNHDEIFQTACCTVCHFTDSRRICIVCKCCRNTQTFFEHSSQRNNSLPWQVRSKFDCSTIIVTVRSTYSHTFNLFCTAKLLEQRKKLLAYSVYIFAYFSVLLCFYRIGSQYITTRIYYSENSISTTDVHSHHVGFFHIYCHDIKLLKVSYMWQMYAIGENRTNFFISLFNPCVIFYILAASNDT